MQKHWRSKNRRNKPSTLRKRSHIWGIMAEYLCVLLLLLKGYVIIAIRHRNYMGEIDIIAKKGSILAFIEVKARTQTETALYSVTPAKQKILAKAATAFMATHKKYSHLGLRFDVMVVTSPTRIHHLKNAWRTE